jgi:signal transduction histidine kinase
MVKNEGPKILVVNDDAGSLLALTSILLGWSEENGCAVHTASSGQEALRQVLIHDFAVILLDVKMPGMNGFETAEAIHLRARSSTIPIIFVTAFLSDELNQLKAYKQGAVDYLFTPVIPQMLLAKVSVFVALAKKNMQLESQAAELIEMNSRLKVEMAERSIAVQQNRAKDEFLAMLGHELRNPLSAITSAAAVMAFPGISLDAAKRARQIIQRQSQHLSHIVDDLLDLARVRNGKILLNKRPMDLAVILTRCLETLHATGRTASYSVELDMPATWVDADATRIEQVFTNLMDNALKYTPTGGNIRVRLGVEGGSAVLTVIDSGIGISEELLPHIFDVFSQGSDTLDRARGGLGIGLALVQQLVELHGGSVRAVSDGLGRGSRFIVELPAITVAPSRPDDSKQPSALKSHNILLIEDNIDSREMMSALLEMYGHRVRTAQDGTSGVDMAFFERSDIALIDIGLPGISGYEVAMRLRAAPETRDMRLIALTGYGQEMDQQRARDAGFDLHLVKPVEADVLLRALQVRTSIEA